MASCSGGLAKAQFGAQRDRIHHVEVAAPFGGDEQTAQRHGGDAVIHRLGVDDFRVIRLRLGILLELPVRLGAVGKVLGAPAVVYRLGGMVLGEQQHLHVPPLQGVHVAEQNHAERGRFRLFRNAAQLLERVGGAGQVVERNVGQPKVEQRARHDAGLRALGHECPQTRGRAVVLLQLVERHARPEVDQRQEAGAAMAQLYLFEGLYRLPVATELGLRHACPVGGVGAQFRQRVAFQEILVGFQRERVVATAEPAFRLVEQVSLGARGGSRQGSGGEQYGKPVPPEPEPPAGPTGAGIRGPIFSEPHDHCSRAARTASIAFSSQSPALPRNRAGGATHYGAASTGGATAGCAGRSAVHQRVVFDPSNGR